MSSPLLHYPVRSGKVDFLFSDAKVNDSISTPTGTIFLELYHANPLIAFAVIGVAIYLFTVRHLRYRRINALQDRYGYTYKDFKDLNYKDAQAITGTLLLLESPWMFLTGKDFAFLRVSSLNPSPDNTM